MSLILEGTGSVPYFTNVRATLEALGLHASAYDWYISDIETNYAPPGLTNDDQWISGEAFERLITEHEVQFIWGVLSAFPRGVRFVVEHPPAADGNADFWSGKALVPQLAGAQFEIVSWDSSATILIGLPSEAEERFQTAYPAARHLPSTAR